MKVRWIASTADPRIASVRIRALAIVRELRARGMDVKLLNAANPSCDVAVFCKSYSQRDIELARRIRNAGGQVIFDLCDNHFLVPEAAGRLREMMQTAHRWVFSTAELQRAAIEAVGEDKSSLVIPDAVEVEQRHWVESRWQRTWAVWKLRRWQRQSQAQLAAPGARLIWFGNHAGSVRDSGMAQLNRLRDVLEQSARDHGATLTVVSNSRAAYSKITAGWGIRTFYVDWHLATFLDVLRMHAIALMPFDRSAFNVVKSNNRLAASLYNGVAVVADAIPSYQEFADCALLDDWSGIARYIHDEGLRRRHVELGRARVAASYSLEVVAGQWQSLFAAQK
jgi:hypothetical protein